MYALLGRLTPLEDAIFLNHIPFDFSIDMSRCGYLGPDGAVLLARLRLSGAAKNCRFTTIQIPNSPIELKHFFHYSGLQHILETGRLVHPEDRLPHPVIPLRQYRISTFQDADPVIGLIRQHEKLSEDDAEYMRICVNEVLQNIQDHAKSPIGGLMTARYMKSSHQVRIAIADAGLGIAHTLKVKYPDTTPITALQRVIQGNYSAHSRQNNMGLGISNLCQIVLNQLRGQIILLSGKAVAHCSNHKEWTYTELDRVFNGTAVFLTLPVTS